MFSYERLAIYAGTYFWCLIGGFVPVVNAELYIATAGAMADPNVVFAIVVAGTFGQMTAKTALFMGGRGLGRLALSRDAGRMRSVVEKARAWRGPIELFVFVSAAAGIPPFYIVSLLGGALELSVARFVIVGFAARLIRFMVIAATAHSVAT